MAQSRLGSQNRFVSSDRSAADLIPYKFEIEMNPNRLDNYIGLFEDDLCTLTDTSNT